MSPLIMTYQEQLESLEWQNKRSEILKRDSFKCQECSNQNLINELDDGFFSGYCLQYAIDIENFGKNKYMKAGIDEKYSKLLDNYSIVYSKKNPKWRRMVLGIRKLNLKERAIFIEYENTIIKMRKEFNSNDIDYYSKFKNFSKEASKIREQRRIKFIELKKENNIIEFEWKIMLGLHIHHNYYIDGLSAWEYKNDALVTLCYTCHENLHKNKKIQVYNNDKDLKLIGQYSYCKKCHGAGWFPKYAHVQSGICFRCNGARYEELIP